MSIVSKVALFGVRNSFTVFHSLQAVQRPTHLTCSVPHSVQNHETSAPALAISKGRVVRVRSAPTVLIPPIKLPPVPPLVVCTGCSPTFLNISTTLFIRSPPCKERPSRKRRSMCTASQIAVPMIIELLRLSVPKRLQSLEVVCVDVRELRGVAQGHRE